MYNVKELSEIVWHVEHVDAVKHHSMLDAVIHSRLLAECEPFFVGRFDARPNQTHNNWPKWFRQVPLVDADKSDLLATPPFTQVTWWFR